MATVSRPQCDDTWNSHWAAHTYWGMSCFSVVLSIWHKSGVCRWSSRIVKDTLHRGEWGGSGVGDGEKYHKHIPLYSYSLWWKCQHSSLLDLSHFLTRNNICENLWNSFEFWGVRAVPSDVIESIKNSDVGEGVGEARGVGRELGRVDVGVYLYAVLWFDTSYGVATLISWVSIRRLARAKSPQYRGSSL